VEIPEGGAEGVLVCCGGLSGGFAVFMKDGKLHWEHNYYNEVRYRVSSSGTIPPGRHVLSAEVKVDKQGKFETGGTVTLRLDRKRLAKVASKSRLADFLQPMRASTSAAIHARLFPTYTRRRSPSLATLIRVMVDVSEATFEDLAAQHEAQARLAMATQ
jgi:arylsulfatase